MLHLPSCVNHSESSSHRSDASSARIPNADYVLYCAFKLTLSE
ncbi:MAG: hypothetical protein N3G74_00440 [Candidatus Micrarchaeota archaeon]|nr:hypothetical protein [Candidatus Micrarchaeota archaeon]